MVFSLNVKERNSLSRGCSGAKHRILVYKVCMEITLMILCPKIMTRHSILGVTFNYHHSNCY